MDKQTVAYPCNGILSAFEKEGNSNICYNMDESWWHYAKWDKSVTQRIMLYDSTSVRYTE